MACKPVALDHVNIYVRNAERSYQWYTDVLGLHTQDIFRVPGTDRMRAAFLACDPDHAHIIALFEVGDDAPGLQKGQVGLNHVAWRMESLDDLKDMYQRLNDRPVPIRVADHSVSIGVYFWDPTAMASRSTTSCRAASGTRSDRSRNPETRDASRPGRDAPPVAQVPVATPA